MEKHWPLYMPLLLRLLEDTHASFRRHGLELADLFIHRCPAHILRDSGIVELLEDVIFPTLHFLPTQVGEDESLQLLEPAYRSLVALARASFDRERDMPRKRRLLGRLLKDAVFLSYAHTSEYASIVRFLARQARIITDELGIYATKHLKVRLPPDQYAPILSPFLLTLQCRA